MKKLKLLKFMKKLKLREFIHRISCRLYLTWNKALDWIVPLDVWFAKKIYTRYWLSKLAKRNVSSWQRRANNNHAINNLLYDLHLPENWPIALLLAFIIIFIPQILIAVLFYPPNCPPSNNCEWNNPNLFNALGIAWQVTAAIIGITFVIIVFIVQYANDREYERRAFPIFLAETRMLFTVSFGLFTILSIGLGTFLLSKADKVLRPEFLNSIIIWQILLFIANIILTISVFTRTILILSPEYFRKKFLFFNRRLVSKFVDLELADRVGYKISNDAIKIIGVEFPYFEPDYKAGKIPVSLRNLPRRISKICDINLKMVEIAALRAKRLYPDFKMTDLVFYAKVDHRVGREKPDIALVNPVINRPQVVRFLRESVSVGPMANSSKEKLVNEILLNRDLLLKAVQNQQSDVVKDLLEFYEDILDAFLDAVEKYDLHFSQDEAQNEVRSFADWGMVSAIEKQYSNLLFTVFKTNDSEIIAQSDEIGHRIRMMSAG